MKSETFEAQVVVIGGGGAGLAAAVAAAEAGADVILLEKQRNPGGNSAAALDIFACESPVQKRFNVDAPQDKYFQIAMGFAHWAINPRIIRVFLQKSGDTIRWLEEKGLVFELNKRRFKYFGRELPPSAHCPVGSDGAGIIRALTKSFEALGGRLLCDIGAKEMTASADGKVIEVLAAKRTGGQYKIRANAVVLACGGYGGNKEMLKRYCPYYNENITLCGFPNMGEGIQMAMQMGAATEGLGVLHFESKGLPREPKQLWLLSWRPMTVWVNKRGERFTDEAIDNVFEAGNPVLRQPEKLSFTIIDETVKEHIIKLMEETVMPHYRGKEREVSVKRWLPPGEWVAEEDIGTLLHLAEDKGDAKIADSWDEIARWIGAKPEVLKATIDEYNSFCAKGRDEIFGKDPAYLMPLTDPPYYALRCGMRFLGTIGGIKINHLMEVLGKEEDPIPGLYAAGIDTGGWEPETYNQFLTGTTFGFSINSGRIAGENAAEYVLGK